MKLQRSGKHHIDEREVQKLLNAVATHERSLVEVFPRPVEELITIGTMGNNVSVAFVPTEGLNAGFIVRTLRDRFMMRDQLLEDNDQLRFAGYTHAEGKTAVIFYDRQYGLPAERFTIAHEAGHVFREFVQELVTKPQFSLFPASPTPAQKTITARDTRGYLRIGFDSTPETAETLNAEFNRRNHSPDRLRETKADGFAAELLAPYGQVKRLLRENPGRNRDEYVELLRTYFHVSKTMARVRLAELSVEADPDQTIMDLIA